jgi:hypothetical protein
VKFLEKLRKNLGLFFLNKKARAVNRHRKIYNFSTAQKAGIIFSCQNEEDFQAVKEFKKYLEEKNIDTYVLGFINDKKIPDHLLLRTGFNFFCLKNLDWYYRPANGYIHDFILKNFNILFDFSVNDHFPVHYISLLSPAEYKVGRLTGTDQYDLMIDIKQNKHLPFFIEQVKHYINLIEFKNPQKN